MTRKIGSLLREDDEKDGFVWNFSEMTISKGLIFNLLFLGITLLLTSLGRYATWLAIRSASSLPHYRSSPFRSADASPIQCLSTLFRIR